MVLSISPERLLAQSRAAIECNQLAVRAELKAMYIRKAWRVGLSLDAYCTRFGIPKVWEVKHEQDSSTA